MQILLVDDDPISVFLTEQLFKRHGSAVTLRSFLAASDALIFLRQQLLAGSAPDIIVLDLNMPLLNGWDFLDALQPHEAQLRHECAIYILTSSFASIDTVRVCQYPLVTELFHKPLDSSAIHIILGRAFERVSHH